MHQSDCYQRIKSRKDGGKDRNLKTRKNEDGFSWNFLGYYRVLWEKSKAHDDHRSLRNC